jgi:uncharacterized phage-associated protein
MPYDPIAIANYFIDLAKTKGESVSPMKLQKLIFFAHGWNLAIKDAPLIDEQVEAWTFGPVIRRVYRVFREYGDRPVTERGRVSNLRGISQASAQSAYWRVPSIDDEPELMPFTKQLLDRIWDVYGRYSAIQLSNTTHQAGTPWDQAVRKCKEENNGELLRGTDIPTAVIRDYFVNLDASKRVPTR